MAQPIRFHFDFSSPYAWYALPRINELARRHGRELELVAVLLWAVFKAQGIGSPLEAPSKKAYLFADIERSAAFHGAKLHLPLRLPFSAHVAARFFHGAQAVAPEKSFALAQDIFAAFFERGEDIGSLPTLQAIGAAHGFDAATVARLTEAPESRAALSAAVERAAADGMVGSPFFLLDGEGFFGADRLPQIAWRLEQADK